MAWNIADWFKSRRELVAERDAADRRAKFVDAMVARDFEEAFLQSAGPSYSPGGGFEMVFRTPVASLMAESLCQMLKEMPGAENYVEVSAFHPKLGMLAFTVQRVRGETPAGKAARLQRKLDELLSPTPIEQEG